MRNKSVISLRRHSASAIVELVLIFPLLMTLGFGIIEYSSFIYAKTAVQNAAREGARAAIQSSATNASVQSVIDSVMANAGLQSSGYTTTFSPSNLLGLPTGQAISITVTFTWGNLGLHPLPSGMGGISSSKTLTSTVVMHRE
jgi:Flp pilus assembly protein TadG